MNVTKWQVKFGISFLMMGVVLSLPFYASANSGVINLASDNSGLFGRVNSIINSIPVNFENKTKTPVVTPTHVSLISKINISGFKNLGSKIISYEHSLGSAIIQTEDYTGNLIGQLADQTYTKEQVAVKKLTSPGTLNQINSQTTAVISPSPVPSPIPVLNNNAVVAISSPTPVSVKKVTAPVLKSPTPTPSIKNSPTLTPSQSSNNVTAVALADLKNDLDNLKAIVAILPRSTYIVGKDTSVYITPPVSAPTVIGGNVSLSSNSISVSSGNLTIESAGGAITLSGNINFSGTSSSSFVGSLGISKGLSANSYQGAGLDTCGDTSHALNYSQGKFSCGSITGSGISWYSGTTTNEIAFYKDSTTASGSINLTWDSTKKRLGLGTSTPKGPLFIADTLAGDASSSSFAIRSNNTVGSIASISATLLTTGDAIAIRIPAIVTGTTFTGDVIDVNDTAGVDIFTLTGKGRIGLGTSAPVGPFNIVDSLAGSIASGSFVIKSSNTVGAVASISANSLTTGTAFRIIASSSAMTGATALAIKAGMSTGNVASISAFNLTTGNIFSITIASSSKFSGNIFQVKNNNVTSPTTLYVLTNRGRIGLGTSAPVGPFNIVDSLAGSIASGSFVIKSSNTVGAVASISANSLTTGTAFRIIASSSAMTGATALAIKAGMSTGNVASISAFNLTTGNVFGIKVASSSNFTGNIFNVTNNNAISPSTLYVLTSKGRMGLGTSAPTGPFNIVDALAGSTSSGSFSIRSSNTVSSVASISAFSLTTGNVFSITATTSTFSGNVFKINAKNLNNGGTVFNISVPASTSANSAHGILLVTSANGATIASMSMGGNLALRGWSNTRGASSTCTSLNTPSSGCIDYAETYPTQDNTIGAADLVAVDPDNSQNIVKATKSLGILGVVSTNPAVLINGSELVSGAITLSRVPQGHVPVALAGRVPLKVSVENGPIKIGDYLRASPDMPGIAMKAQKAGNVVGQAMENYSANSDNEIGQVMTFIEPGYYNGKNLEDFAGSFDSSSDSGLANALLTQFIHQAPVASTNMSDIIADRIAASIEIISPKIYGDSVFANKVQARTGITTFDDQTGEPYCISVSGGQIKTTAGDCGNPVSTPVSGSTTTLTPISSPMSTPEITPTDSPIPTLEITPTETSSIDSPTPEPTSEPTPVSEPQI